MRLAGSLHNPTNFSPIPNNIRKGDSDRRTVSVTIIFFLRTSKTGNNSHIRRLNREQNTGWRMISMAADTVRGASRSERFRSLRSLTSKKEMLAYKEQWDGMTDVVDGSICLVKHVSSTSNDKGSMLQENNPDSACMHVHTSFDTLIGTYLVW